MSPTLWKRFAMAAALAALTGAGSQAQAALLLNYQFDEVEGDAPSGQTTPDSSGNFTSTAGTVNAVLGHGTNTPGSDFPQLTVSPVVNYSAGIGSLNLRRYMSFPGNPAAGSIGSAIERVEIADASAGALDATFSHFTVGLWLNPSSTDRDRFAIGKIGGGGQRGWQMYSPGGSNNLVIDYFDAPGGVDRSLVVNDVLPLNTWTHVIFAFDGTNQVESVYVNNILQTSVDTAASGSPTVLTALNGLNSAAFRVGHRGATGTNVGSWAGGIDDVRIYDEYLAFSSTGSSTGTGSLLAAIPEPSSLGGILSVGIVVLACRRRQHR